MRECNVATQEWKVSVNYLLFPPCNNNTHTDLQHFIFAKILFLLLGYL